MEADIQGDLSPEIAKLRDLINKAEGQPALQRSLIETLNRVCRDQDRRNLLYSNVLSLPTVLAYAKAYSEAVSRALRSEIEDDGQFARISDRILAELSRVPPPVNDRSALKLLK